jgi:hypothetical protein
MEINQCPYLLYSSKNGCSSPGINMKLSLYLIKSHAIKTYRQVEVRLRSFLISALHVGEWSASRVGDFEINSTEIMKCT